MKTLSKEKYKYKSMSLVSRMVNTQHHSWTSNWNSKEEIVHQWVYRDAYFNKEFSSDNSRFVFKEGCSRQENFKIIVIISKVFCEPTY
jgi:hypothetical protein